MSITAAKGDRVREKKRTVAALLTVKKAGTAGIRNLFGNKSGYIHQHTYVYCRSRAIAERFLRDAEEEGFMFGDGKKPTEMNADDIFALNDDFTMSYTGFAPHAMFGGGGSHVIWIDYENISAGQRITRR